MALAIQAERLRTQLQAAKRTFALHRPPSDATRRLIELQGGFAMYKDIQLRLAEREKLQSVDAASPASVPQSPPLSPLRLTVAECPPRDSVERAERAVVDWLVAQGADRHGFRFETDAQKEALVACLLLNTADDWREQGVDTDTDAAALLAHLCTLQQFFTWRKRIRVTPSATGS
jgi:hypothetical protein